MTEKLDLKSAERAAAILVAAIVLNGCSLVPEMEPPSMITTIGETESFTLDQGDESASGIEQITWWAEIGGDDLNAQVEELLANSFELKEARERVRQAQEVAKQGRAARLPSASAELAEARSRSPDPLGDFSWGNAYTAGLNASWKLDVFGGLRSTERAATLLAEAARLNLIATEQSSIATLVRTWVSAATLQRRLDLAIETAESYRTTYKLTQARFETGSARTSASDVLITKQNLDASLAEIPNLETQLMTQLIVIDQQLGRLPGKAAQTFQGDMIVPTELVAPVGMPATLLTARPDVAAAELSYQAALQDIGAARAELLPGVSLAGSLSFQDGDLSGLFEADEYLASIATSLTQPVFLGGRLRSNLRIEKSKAEELASAYARTALAAISEVETALVQLAGILEELEQLKIALKSAEDSDRISQNRYRQGLQSLLSVLETQRGLFNARLNIILTEQSLLEARIKLHLSLGGAWFDAEANAATEGLSEIH